MDNKKKKNNDFVIVIIVLIFVYFIYSIFLTCCKKGHCLVRKSLVMFGYKM